MEQLQLIGSLWAHQNLIIKTTNEALVQGKNTILNVAPTGSGKSLTFSAMVGEFLKAAPHLRILFTVNRVQLVKQLHKQLTALGFDVGVCSSSFSTKKELTRQVTIASYLSIINIHPPVPYNLIIWDEAHRFASLLDKNGSPLHSWYSAVKEVNPRLRDIGFTATPYTATRPIYGDGHHFTDINCEVSMKEMLRLGILVPLKSFGEKTKVSTAGIKLVNGDYNQSELAKRIAGSTDILDQQITDALTKLDHHDRKCVVWQCVGIDHCEKVAQRLRDRGETVAVIHSEQDDYEQTEDVAEFEAGRRRHLVFVSIVAEGYDHPPIDAIVMLRPTKSPVLAVQSIGRTLRRSPGKEYSLLLDFGDVIKNCGPIDFPFVRERIEDERRRKSDLLSEIPYTSELVLECQKCGKINFGQLTVDKFCDECGDNLFEQREEALKKKLIKQAREYDSLLSEKDMYRVLSMRGKWHQTQDLAHLIELIYETEIGEVREEIYVSPWNPSKPRDVGRWGEYKHATAKLRSLGFTGDDLRSMQLCQHQWTLMPLYVLVLGKSVCLTIGSQPVQRHVAPSEPEQVSLF